MDHHVDRMKQLLAGEMAWLVTRRSVCTLEELQRLGGNQNDPMAIRLETYSGPLFPVWQYDQNGGIHKVVRVINYGLARRYLPFAVAQWWLEDHDYNPLGTVNADLISSNPELLRERARAFLHAE